MNLPAGTEKQILQMTMRGTSIKEIAYVFVISDRRPAYTNIALNNHCIKSVALLVWYAILEKVAMGGA
jgi:hypothetical protein